MLKWISEDQFEKSIDHVSFDKAVQLVSGTIVELDESKFDFEDGQIIEEEYLYDAFRWYGAIDQTYFYLDVAANDSGRVKLLTFHLCADSKQHEPWQSIVEMQPVLTSIGTIRINHIGSKMSTPAFALVRDTNNGRLTATVIYRFNRKEEGQALGEYLGDQYEDSDLFIAERLPL